jgi:hypothetical protein
MSFAPFLPAIAALTGQADPTLVPLTQPSMTQSFDPVWDNVIARASRPVSQFADTGEVEGEAAPAEAATEEAASPLPASPQPAAEPVAVDGAPTTPVDTSALPADGVLDADEVLIDGRRRPGEQDVLPDRIFQQNEGALRPPPPIAFPSDPEFPLPDRWRLSQALGVGHPERFFDPYNHNQFKGDRPICVRSTEHVSEEEMTRRRESQGLKKCKTPRFLNLSEDDWFLALTGVSDTVLEPRTFPIPVGVQTTSRPGSIDVFGRSRSVVAAQTFLFGGSLIKGETTFMPPHIEYRVLLALNASYVDVPERRVLNVKPSKKSHRTDHFLGVQELFVDYHLRNVSDRFDFDSVRVGIQPFQADFRGFLFNDLQMGIRFFGNRDNNRYQYNLAMFWRLEKDTNSGLNSVVQRPRDDWVFFANLYRQDFPVVGITSQVSATVNINREGNEVQIDDNGFPVRPALLGDLRGRDYDVAWLGYSMDGHFGRVNFTGSTYLALGKDKNSFFTSRPTNIRSFFAAGEASIDVDWARFRLSGLYASGDGNPYDNTETGFDAVFENPIFAGADTSYWIRQTIPFAGGGRAIAINSRNGVLNNLRSSKEEGQANFNNPGTILLGAGADFDITPKFRVSTNLNHLWFENTATLQALRVEGSIPKSIGWDASISTIWRPKAIQNVVFRASAAALKPGAGFKDLFASAGRDKTFYSILFNAILSY